MTEEKIPNEIVVKEEEDSNKDMVFKGGQKYPISGSEISSKPAEMSNNVEDYLKTRRGMGICIITRGTVPFKWMLHMNEIARTFPGGLYWKYIAVERMSWAAARNECVRKCRGANFEWLLFIDDDVFLPKDAVAKLLASGKELISGIYWTKSVDNTSPVIFEKMGAGPMYNFEPDKVIPIGGSGLGACLIHMSIFDDFDKAGIPYFVENWVYVDPAGQKLKCPIGEDHYFFLKAKEFGHQAFAHSGILCDHYDHKSDRFFPGEKVVTDICKTQLTKAGRDDLIQEYDKKMFDTSKPTIVFYNDSIPFAGDELARRGVGGSEGDIINLAKEMNRYNKYNVRVYCKCLREGFYDNVYYIDNKKFLKELSGLNTDILIFSREMKLLHDTEFKTKHNVKKIIFWGHDLATEPIWKDFEAALPNMDKIVMLTEFHKNNLLSVFKDTPVEKIVVIPNGVDNTRYSNIDKIKKIKGKCIYSSTPYRGLDILLDMWPSIKRQVPFAELYVFSSIKVYGEFFDDSPWIDLYSLAKRLDGVHYCGTVKQDRLAREQMESELLLYPSTFDETCCVTAMENQTAGTPIISSKRAALIETVKPGCGVLLDGKPHSAEYKESFVRAVKDLLTNDDSKWEQMHTECLKQNFSWKNLANKWLTEFLPDSQGCGKVQPKLDWDATYKKDLAGNQFHNPENRFNFLKQFCKPDSKVLDVGCGLGAFPRFLRQVFPKSEIWGHELSMFAMDHNRQSDKTIMFANHPLESPDFEPDYFDVITCSQVLQYVDEPIKFVKKLYRLLKPAGVLVVIIPEVVAESDNISQKELLDMLKNQFRAEPYLHGVMLTAYKEFIVSIKKLNE